MDRPRPRRPGVEAAGSEEDERRLAEGLIAGSHDAVAELLSRTHHPVYAMACRITQDPDRRRDWTHSALLGILEDLERGRFVYRHPGSFWAWFRKRVYFRLLDEYRRHRRASQREVAPDPETGSLDLSDFGGGVDPADELERVELRAALEECLGRLSSHDQRHALDLLLISDLTYQEIAASLRAPLNTVRAWIRRGRLQVRRCMAERLGWLASRAAGE